MNNNDMINVILALREYHPGLNLTVESGISPVVIRLNDVFIGDRDYILAVSGCGDTFDGALQKLYTRIVSQEDYVIVDSEITQRPVGLKYINETWVTIKEFTKT